MLISIFKGSRSKNNMYRVLYKTYQMRDEMSLGKARVFLDKC